MCKYKQTHMHLYMQDIKYIYVGYDIIFMNIVSSNDPINM